MAEQTGRIPEDKVMLSTVTHVCIAVRDLERTARRFSEKFGIGPFTTRTQHTPQRHGEVRGKPAEYTLKFGYARAGSIIIELVQPLAGETVYDEFLAQRGEGVHHIGFAAAPPLDEELERWAKNGIRPLQANRRDDPEYGWAYMDTEEDVGCVLEIVCDPPLGWWESRSLAEDLKGPLGEG